jgi:hypothetical protein
LIGFGCGTAHAGLPYGTWPEGDQERLRGLFRLIDDIGTEFYFASGAYDLSKGSDVTSAPSPTVRERFYREMGQFFDELADVGLPSVTHHLLETLESFISIDPRGAFLRIGRLSMAARAPFINMNSSVSIYS